MSLLLSGVTFLALPLGIAQALAIGNILVLAFGLLAAFALVWQRFAFCLLPWPLLWPLPFPCSLLPWLAWQWPWHVLAVAAHCVYILQIFQDRFNLGHSIGCILIIWCCLICWLLSHSWGCCLWIHEFGCWRWCHWGWLRCHWRWTLASLCRLHLSVIILLVEHPSLPIWRNNRHLHHQGGRLQPGLGWNFLQQQVPHHHPHHHCPLTLSPHCCPVMDFRILCILVGTFWRSWHQVRRTLTPCDTAGNKSVFEAVSSQDGCDSSNLDKAFMMVTCDILPFVAIATDSCNKLLNWIRYAVVGTALMSL